MDNFALKRSGTGYVLEANGLPVICTAELQVAEETLATVDNEALLQTTRRRSRALAAFSRWRRTGHKIYFNVQNR
jgi:hypothetical protein